MPSETAKMPGETHSSLLRHGASRGLGLQAGEVAWYPNKTDLDARLKRYGKRLGIIGLAMIVLGTIIGFQVNI